MLFITRMWTSTTPQSRSKHRKEWGQYYCTCTEQACSIGFLLFSLHRKCHLKRSTCASRWDENVDRLSNQSNFTILFNWTAHGTETSVIYHYVNNTKAKSLHDLTVQNCIIGQVHPTTVSQYLFIHLRKGENNELSLLHKDKHKGRNQNSNSRPSDFNRDFKWAALTTWRPIEEIIPLLISCWWCVYFIRGYRLSSFGFNASDTEWFWGWHLDLSRANAGIDEQSGFPDPWN